MTQPAPSRTRRVLTSYPVRVIGTLAVVLGLVVLAGRMGLFADSPAEPSQRDTAAAAPQRVPGLITDGVWLVGADVEPGTYRSSGANHIDFCWWGRLSDTTGEAKAIIASGTANTGEPIVVTIEPGDVAFKSVNCEPFGKIS